MVEHPVFYMLRLQLLTQEILLQINHSQSQVIACTPKRVRLLQFLIAQGAA
jgi:hypothetical protein